MALKVGGTTVINDARGLENISNLKTINGNAVLGTGDISIPTYTHPANHPASVITQDGNNRFVTDGEKATWNAKIGTVKTINGQSIVGSGDLVLATSSTFATDITVNGHKFGRGANSDVHTNVAVGMQVLSSNTTGNQNTASGFNAMQSNTTGSENTAIGPSALSQNTTGYNNTATGQSALNGNKTGNNNAAYGGRALQYNTTGINNTASGADALRSNTTASNNSAFGNAALSANTTGENNVAFGTQALGFNVSANHNTAVGVSAMLLNTTGMRNTAIGRGALQYNTTGSDNIAIGSIFNANGQNPVFNVTTEDNRIVMGHTAVTNAYIQVAWTVVSDARDKTNFKAIPHGLDFVKQLKPTAYQFRTDRGSEETNGGVRYGFKAQDIAAIEPEAVIVDTTNPEKLYYNESNLIPVLVKAIQELTARLEMLESRGN
jgi:trimeric autotransporter adhesin